MKMKFKAFYGCEDCRWNILNFLVCFNKVEDAFVLWMDSFFEYGGVEWFINNVQHLGMTVWQFYEKEIFRG